MVRYSVISILLIVLCACVPAGKLDISVPVNVSNNGPTPTPVPFCGELFNSNAKLGTFFFPGLVSAEAQSDGLSSVFKMKDLSTYSGQYMAQNGYIDYSGNNVRAMEFTFDSIAKADVDLTYAIGITNFNDTENMAFFIDELTNNNIILSYSYNGGFKTPLNTFVNRDLQGFKILVSYDEFTGVVTAKVDGVDYLVPMNFRTGGNYYFGAVSVVSAGNFTVDETVIRATIDAGSWENERYSAKDLCNYFGSNTDELFIQDSAIHPSGLLFSNYETDHYHLITGKNKVKLINNSGSDKASGFNFTRSHLFDGTHNEDVQFEIKILSGHNSIDSYGIYSSLGKVNVYALFDDADGVQIDKFSETFDGTFFDLAPGSLDMLSPGVSLGVLIKSNQEIVYYRRENNVATLIASTHDAQPLPVSASFLYGVTYDSTADVEIEVITEKSQLADISAFHAPVTTSIAEAASLKKVLATNTLTFYVPMHDAKVLGSFFDEELKFIDNTGFYQVYGFGYAAYYNDNTANHYNPLLFSKSPDGYSFSSTLYFDSDDVANKAGLVFDAVDENNYKLFRMAQNATFNAINWEVVNVVAGVGTVTGNTGSFASTNHSYLVKLEKSKDSSSVSISIDGSNVTTVTGVETGASTRKLGFYLEERGIYTNFLLME
jgi:hypothetical protein